MLYLIVAVIAGLLICLVYIFRLMRNRSQALKQRRRAHAHPELPVHQIGPRPTLAGTAHDVANHMFPAPAPADDYTPFHRRALGSDGIEGRAGTMFDREERAERRRERRDQMDLPAYSAETPATDTMLDVAPPPPAHLHERGHDRVGSVELPTIAAVEPPKYTPTSP